MFRGIDRQVLLGIFRSAGPASLAVAAGVVAAKGLGLGKELLVANRLGAGTELDRFLVAFIFPAFIVGVFSGAIQAAFVPEYLACKSRNGAAAARRLASQGATLVCVLLAIVVLLCWPVAMLLLPMLASGFAEPALEAVQALIPWLLPLAVLYCLSAHWGGILNAEGRFGLVATIPAATPLCVALALVIRSPLGGTERLVAGTAVGAALECFLTLWVARRLGFAKLFSASVRETDWRSPSRQLVAMVGAASLMALTLLVDQSFAARLEVGSVSVLSFGTRLNVALASVLVMIVSTLALPMMSRLAAREDWERFRRAFSHAFVVLAVGTMTIAAGIALASDAIVDLIFLRGAFSGDAAREVARVQFFHAWHIPFYVLGMLALRALHAMRLAHLAVLGSAVNLLVNILTNVLAAPVLGVAGVALATTTMYAASCAYLTFLARRALGVRSRAA